MHVATITIEVWCFLLGESRLNHCFSFCILTWNWHKFLLPRSIELLIMQVLGSYIFLVHKSLALNHVSPLHNTVSTHNILPYVLFSFTFVYMSFYHNDTIHEDILYVCLGYVNILKERAMEVHWSFGGRTSMRQKCYHLFQFSVYLATVHLWTPNMKNRL